MTPTDALRLAGRDEAVEEIAAHIRSRDHYILPIHPDIAPTQVLGELSDWTAYVDAGHETVLCFLASDPLDAGVLDALLALRPQSAAGQPGAVVVAVVPKTTVAPERFARAVSAMGAQPAPDQDIVLMSVGESARLGRRFALPLLFVDAVELIEPALARQLRAQMSVGAITEDELDQALAVRAEKVRMAEAAARETASRLEAAAERQRQVRERQTAERARLEAEVAARRQAAQVERERRERAAADERRRLDAHRRLEEALAREERAAARAAAQRMRYARPQRSA